MVLKKSVKLLGFFVPIILVLVIHYVFLFFGFYSRFSWLDIPVHFLGGFSFGIAYFFVLLELEKNSKYLKLNKVSRFVFVVALVSLPAVFWEFYEFLLEYYTGLNFQGTINDTMLDLLMGILGGVSISILLETAN